MECNKPGIAGCGTERYRPLVAQYSLKHCMRRSSEVYKVVLMCVLLAASAVASAIDLDFFGEHRVVEVERG
jgi:hypothetical protein